MPFLIELKKRPVENESNKRFDSVYSNKVRAGKRRTYFFDVRQTKGDDYYITLTESTRRFNGDGYERHKIFLYKEDFNRFLQSLQDTVDHVKTELMPDYDYDEFTKRQLEWEATKAAEAAAEAENQNNAVEASEEALEEAPKEVKADAEETPMPGTEPEASVENTLDGGDDDISW
jgi:hypothetical protein